MKGVPLRASKSRPRFVDGRPVRAARTSSSSSIVSLEGFRRQSFHLSNGNSCRGRWWQRTCTVWTSAHRFVGTSGPREQTSICAGNCRDLVRSSRATRPAIVPPTLFYDLHQRTAPRCSAHGWPGLEE